MGFRSDEAESNHKRTVSEVVAAAADSIKALLTRC